MPALATQQSSIAERKVGKVVLFSAIMRRYSSFVMSPLLINGLDEAVSIFRENRLL
nr:MAG TPA: hypothetical protein [Caudoviricetes sp.]